MSETDELREIYLQLLQKQNFIEEELDYSILDQTIPRLKRIAFLGNSAISVFDLYKKRHVFVSDNFGEMLGFQTREVKAFGGDFLDSKIHPDDFKLLLKNGISALKFFQNIPIRERNNYKLISEFRALNAHNKFVRVIEQHQPLEIQSNGQIWLNLSILDLSPNQNNLKESANSELLNFKTGKIVPFLKTTEELSSNLTKREIEVLKLVKEGFLSKEISGKLFISLHTVNTYRQNVLKKLGANNSMEAVWLASKLGLI